MAQTCEKIKYFSVEYIHTLHCEEKMNLYFCISFVTAFYTKIITGVHKLG